VSDLARYAETRPTPTHFPNWQALYLVFGKTPSDGDDTEVSANIVVLARHIHLSQKGESPLDLNNMESVLRHLECKADIELKQPGSSRGVTREEVEAAIAFEKKGREQLFGTAPKGLDEY